MIKSLTIRNYALIQELDLQPGAALNIITGETGAGKSIMLGAIALIMGNRADSKVLWDENQKCIVEAQFDLSDYELKPIFDAQDLDYDELCIIRREISPNGKSRAFVNDLPVTLDILKAITIYLLDVHSQHESLELGEQQYQINILDQYGRHSAIKKTYAAAYQQYLTARNHHRELQERKANANQDEDYNRFILKELEEARLDEINVDSLENDLLLQENAEEIKAKIAYGEQLLDGHDAALLNQLQELSQTLRQLSQIAPVDFTNLYERVESALIDLKDLLSELTHKNDQILFDPEKLLELKSQSDLLFRLQAKHQANSVQDLIIIRDNIATKLNLSDTLEEDIAAASIALKKATDQLMAAGAALTKVRQASAEHFAKAIESVIHQIGIENGRVEITLSSADPGPYGLDKVQFLFSANKGLPMRNIRDVASGGEFSRVIFAIKYLIADKTALPTIIFDEIDTGVSGEVAIQLARMMKRMAANHQVIAISHLPQFAAGGDSHFYVYKDHSNARSTTLVRHLQSDERIKAVAQMLGGANPTEGALENARELIELMSS